MNKLTRKLVEFGPEGVVSVPELAILAPGGDNQRHAQTKRAMAAGDIVNIRRGLYCLSDALQKKRLNPYVVAQHIYGPSYISLESALSFHGWIPEAVYTVTSVCYKLSKEFDTPLGRFSYSRVPQKVFYSGVDHKTDENGKLFMVAAPLKALADYVYVHKCSWQGIAPAIESLRVEPEYLEQLSAEDFKTLDNNYKSSRVKTFLKTLRKELKL